MNALNKELIVCLSTLIILLLLALMNQYAALGGWSAQFIGCMLKNLLACCVFIAALKIDEHVLERFIPVGYCCAVFLLFCVTVKGITVKGATRWVYLGPLSIQPSEIAKIFTPLMVAHTIFFLRKARPIIIFLVVSALNIIPAFFIVRQPDLGSALLLLSAGMFPLLMTRIPIRFFLILIGIFCCFFPLSWSYLHSYQQERILTLLYPERDPLGQGYHVQQSKIAIGSGGFLGKGFRFNTQADYDFLPEHDTDFAFALFAEERGFLGCLVVILLFLFLKINLLFLILKTKSYYAQLIMFSLMAPFFLYVIINASMVSGLLPVVGVPMPFFSRGGTNLLSVMLSLGLVFSLYRRNFSK